MGLNCLMTCAPFVPLIACSPQIFNSLSFRSCASLQYIIGMSRCLAEDSNFWIFGTILLQLPLSRNFPLIKSFNISITKMAYLFFINSNFIIVEIYIYTDIPCRSKRVLFLIPSLFSLALGLIKQDILLLYGLFF